MWAAAARPDHVLGLVLWVGARKGCELDGPGLKTTLWLLINHGARRSLQAACGPESWRFCVHHGNRVEIEPDRGGLVRGIRRARDGPEIADADEACARD